MTSDRPLRFDSPASYRIVVQGVIPEMFHSYFEGMKIDNIKNPKGSERTAITASLKDQAALTGLINMLYDLHFLIIRVEHITDEISQAE